MYGIGDRVVFDDEPYEVYAIVGIHTKREGVYFVEPVRGYPVEEHLFWPVEVGAARFSLVESRFISY